MERRDLPSMSQLAAFEALCRLGSTVAAARELGMTQGAVSRLVAALEARLGVALVRRVGRHLLPTPAAAVWAADLSGALERIAGGAARLRAGTGVMLAVLPGFGANWLAPRLAGFRAAHPGVAVHLATRLEPFDLAAEGFDAAVHFGAADWPAAAHMKLWEERVLPCAAPGADLHGMALLGLQTRPDAWARWFAARGEAGRAPAVVFDQFAPMIAAAVHGLGVALLPEFLAEAELAAGRLVALAPAQAAEGAYWLVWPKGAESPALTAFRSWLSAQVG